MLNAVAEISLNGVTELDVADYAGFYLYQYLDKGLPYGYFQLNDRSSYIISHFENLQVGAKVDIVLKNIQDPKDSLTFPTFYILKLEDDFSTDPSKLAGTIRVWFGHPWFLYKDNKNHAFNPMNNGKLIKKILEDKSRGMKFEVNNDLFNTTDDTGKYSRYKTAESDWDFIQNKLIPFTSIGLLPPLFYCNLLKKKEEKKYKFSFNLTNSEKLYKQNPKIIISPSQEAVAEKDAVKEIEAICRKSNIDAGNCIYFLQTLNLQILKEENIRYVSPVIYLENINLIENKDPEQKRFYSLGSKLKNKLANKSGSTFGNLLPLDLYYMTILESTSVNMIKNRNMQDALSLVYSTGKDLDNMFVLTVEVNFCGDKVTIGDTVEFYTPSVTENEKKKESWLKGKWIITGLEDHSSPDDPNQLLSKLYLSRPSFIGDTNKTLLSMYNMLYEAE